MTFARRIFVLWSLLFVGLTMVSPAHAAEPGEELVIAVLTFGPGDHPFFKFGHNAILVHDASIQRDMVYNFGTFSFDSPWLLVDFLKGRLKYWLSVQSLRGTVAAYRQEARSIDVQELNLTPAQRRALANDLEQNASGDNKYYKYDYYRDNCSTRVRDVVDRAIGGRLHDASRGPASMSWRDHTRRLTADDLPVYLGLHVAMGDLIDRKIDVWDEMFLPAKLQETLRRVMVVGPQGEEPLVKKEQLLLAADRPPVRTTPPHWTPRMAGLGVLLGGVLAVLGRSAARSRSARILLGLLLALTGFLLGILGWIFSLLWAFTDHEVAHRNENILQCVPWALLLVALALNAARGSRRSLDLTFRLTLAAAAASLLGLLLKALPWFDQNNWEIIALLLPFWAGAAFALVAWRRAHDAQFSPKKLAQRTSRNR